MYNGRGQAGAGSSNPIARASDEALVKLVTMGSNAALELLFTKYKIRIYRFALRILGNAGLAEDVVSEVFLELWHRPHRFEGRSQVATWLFAIARNKALHQLRRTCPEHLEEGNAANVVDEADDPEVILQTSRRSALVRKCLSQLSPAQREIVDLVYYHEKTVTEVAEIVGIPPGTVKTRMFHARSRMEELLARAGLHQFAMC